MNLSNHKVTCHALSVPNVPMTKYLIYWPGDTYMRQGKCHCSLRGIGAAIVWFIRQSVDNDTVSNKFRQNLHITTSIRIYNGANGFDNIACITSVVLLSIQCFETNDTVVMRVYVGCVFDHVHMCVCTIGGNLGPTLWTGTHFNPNIDK